MIKKRIIASLCCMAGVLSSCDFDLNTIKDKFVSKESNSEKVEETVQTAVVNDVNTVYEWRNLEINGGGYVSGVVCSTGIQGLMYARTDRSGAFKYDNKSETWVSITDFITTDENHLMSVESLVCDTIEPNRVYMVCGSYDGGNGAIFSSSDYGETWQRFDLPFACGGDTAGRACGERLAIDPNDSRIIYYGSRSGGLWKSSNYGKTWSVVPAFDNYGNFAQDNAEIGVMWIVFDKESGEFGNPSMNIYAGVADIEGNTIYKSENAGITWEAIDTGLAGYYPVQAKCDGDDNIYMIFNNNVSPEPEPGSGYVYSYNMVDEEFRNITPPSSSSGSGYGSIAVSPQNSNVIAVSTLGYRYPKDNIYISHDGGEHWTAFHNSDTDYFRLSFSSSGWLEKKMDNSLGNWITSICIDPFDSSRVIFATEKGVFSASETEKLFEESTEVTVNDLNKGLSILTIDDMVATSDKIYSVSSDWGGFVNTNSETVSSFEIEGSVDIDSAWKNPDIAVRCGEHGKYAMTPVLFTDNGGETWYSTATLPFEYTSSSVNGSVAVSAEGSTFIWSPDDKGVSPVFTDDFGQTWNECEGLPSGALVCADKNDNMKYYAVSENSFYSSSDGGRSFERVGTRISENMKPYVSDTSIWLCGEETFYSVDGGITFEKLNGVSSECMAFGKSSDGLSEVIYIAGNVADKGYGVYSSSDNGKSWIMMNGSENIFGKKVIEIVADTKDAGRIYVATDGRGILTVK